jgi:hypothetical protein
MSERAELARRVLLLLAIGEEVHERDALQLRIWAIRRAPEDALLPLEVIARRILREEEHNKQESA